MAVSPTLLTAIIASNFGVSGAPRFVQWQVEFF